MTVSRAGSIWKQIGYSTRSIPWALIGCCIAMAALLALQKSLYPVHFRLPESDYFKSWLAIPAFRSFARLGLVLVPTIMIAYHGKSLQWNLSDPWQRANWYILATISVIAIWAFALLPYNFYYDQWHTDARLLIVGCGLGVLWHPVFIPSFLMLVSIFIHQLHYPLLRHSYTDKQIILDLLSLYIGFLVLRTVYKPTPRFLFLLFVLISIAAGYVIPGFEKLTIDWWQHEELKYLLLGANANGWLAGLSPRQIDTVFEWIDYLNPVLLIVSLAIEVAGLLVLYKRWGAIALLTSWISLHLGIFLVSGILFWKWILIDATVLVTLCRVPLEERKQLFGRRTGSIALCLILFSPLWLRPQPLGWFDTPLVGVFRYTAIDKDGLPYELIPRQMSPYDFALSQGRFNFLTHIPKVTKTYGSTRDHVLLNSLVGANDSPQVQRIIDEAGRPNYDESQHHRMIRLLESYIDHKNGHPSRGRWLEPWTAPQHKHTGWVSELAPFANAPMQSIRVDFIYYWHQGTQRHDVAAERVLDIHLR